MPSVQSRVDLYAALRRDSAAGLSNRALQRKYGVTWSTVNKALPAAWPQPGAAYAPRASKLDPFKAMIDEILRVDLDAAEYRCRR